MTAPALAAPTSEQVSSGVRGTYVAFAGAGVTFASWASRIPQVRDHLGLSPAELGLVLLAIAAGSVIALPLSGPVVHRFGSARTVAVTAAMSAGALVVIGLGYLVGIVPVVVGLFLLGVGYGAWDVAMNVQGALVEQHLGRTIMSRFHAGFSLGTVAGALFGALMVALHVPVTAHLLVVAVVIALVVPWTTRWMVHDAAGAQEDHEDAGRRGALASWREPRTLLIGVFVLCFAFAEGAGNDWVGVAMIDGYGAPAAVGTVVFAAFLSAMTLGRWFGPGVLDRYGRVPVVRSLAVLAIVGSLLFVLAPVTPLALVGVVLWGLGVSLGFPVGMSAGADEPRLAAGRVSVIASIGYCAFLAGPPVVGLLGEQHGVLRALIAVSVLLGVAVLLSGAIAAPRALSPAASERPGPSVSPR